MVYCIKLSDPVEFPLT
uniref:Uncharacterized protein n=1 Tax=Anguilla anguilla TaxID=7936 RepID=A0A0E9XQE8_ANGAN